MAAASSFKSSTTCEKVWLTANNLPHRQEKNLAAKEHEKAAKEE
jgi:hypothetical protein